MDDNVQTTTDVLILNLELTRFSNSNLAEFGFGITEQYT